MTNPTIPWQLIQIDPDTDAPRLMQNFESVLDWLLVEAVHRHHVQSITVDYSAQGAGVGQAYTGLTWPEPFAPNVVPRVTASPNSTNATKPAALETVAWGIYDIDNVGCSIYIANSAGVPVGAGSYMTLVAVDPTWDVSQ